MLFNQMTANLPELRSGGQSGQQFFVGESGLNRRDTVLRKMLVMEPMGGLFRLTPTAS